MLKTLNVKNILPVIYEADDIIAIIQNLYKDEHVQIITADKDLCQLINERTAVYDPIRKVLFTESNFEQILGVSQHNFLLKKAILGDKSDNITGVSGIGNKKFEKVLTKEIILTEEQNIIVQRNLQLIDLKESLKCEEETLNVKEQLAVTMSRDMQTFNQICTLCGFNQILNNFSSWENNFK